MLSEDTHFRCLYHVASAPPPACAPQADGAALFDPPLSEAPATVAANRSLLADFDRLAEFPADYRKDARKTTLVALAHSEGQNPESVAEDLPLIMSGHQPELFHSGVWLKNFAISSIARGVAGKAINLVIDNDTIRSAAIRVPTGAMHAPQIVSVPFDATGEAIPWQDRLNSRSQNFSKLLSRSGENLQPAVG